jgi:selenocysteine lyase/cysteine desulfurase
MLSGHFQEFFRSNGDWLHCCAHSHHPWPDVTRAAQLAYWDDSARLTDRKWDKVFGEVVPEAQRHIARHLQLPQPQQIAFAPNTHEFVVRLYSCLDWGRKLRVLTSAHEFHSFERQTRRLEETGRIDVQRVDAAPYDTFAERFCARLDGRWDLVWLSQVFFDSGFRIADLERIVRSCPAQALVVIDGYHAFAALPVGLTRIAQRAFFVAGGYKYAMAGEGACFLAVPPGPDLRPVVTGWFSDFAGLSGVRGATVGYGPDGMRFFGATFDPSGLYRLNAVMRWLEREQVDFAAVHAHAARLQNELIDALRRRPIDALPVERLVPPEGEPRGNFLTFDLPWAAAAEEALHAHRISVDRRGERLRMGFGVYQDDTFVERLLERMRPALAQLAVPSPPRLSPSPPAGEGQG